ncbi:hypothetical protein IQ07DRAFT_626493 [Pyrenochaeta sp. DS3sAY3a]|nr:hypothetical protein IQ07DRAFT_626493 [Pyrenochaeta sp. DS3sAY3a]
MPSPTPISKTGANDDNVIFTANEDEVARLDIQHKVVQACMPKPILAPVDLDKEPLRILDQATGSGIFLRDLRALHPHTPHTYTGTDIETSYFPSSPTPDTSYHFQSMTAPWPASWNQSFDLVHSRMALPGVGTTPLTTAIEGLLGLVKPGGWIQFVEMHWEGWSTGAAMTALHAATRKLLVCVTEGQGVDLEGKIRGVLGAKGWVNVGGEVVSVRLGKSADESVRELSERSMLATTKGVVETLGKIGLGSEELEGLPERVVREIRGEGGEWQLFVVCAQKPVN